MKKFALLLIGVLAVSASADDLAENQARFAQVTGTVQVLTQGAADWIDAHIDLPIEPGDRIQVGEDGGAELSMSRNVLLFLDSDTEAVAERASPQGGRLTLLHGVLLGTLQPAEGLVGEWDFETPMGVCDVRGAEFALTHSEEQGTHLGVFKGLVRLTPADNGTDPVSPVMINAKEEGVLEKRKPLKKLHAFSPVVQAHAVHVGRLEKRFDQVGGVWVPMTVPYRQELRRKFVAAPAPHSKRRRGPGKRIQSPQAD